MFCSWLYFIDTILNISFIVKVYNWTKVCISKPFFQFLENLSFPWSPLELPFDRRKIIYIILLQEPIHVWRRCPEWSTNAHIQSHIHTLPVVFVLQVVCYRSIFHYFRAIVFAIPLPSRNFLGKIFWKISTTWSNNIRFSTFSFVRRKGCFLRGISFGFRPSKNRPQSRLNRSYFGIRAEAALCLPGRSKGVWHKLC